MNGDVNELTRRKNSLPEPVLYDLTASNPTTADLPYDWEAIREGIKNGVSRPYRPDPMGLLSARESVSDYYRVHGITAPADNIVLTASTSEAYSLLIKLFCNAGDEVLLPRPGYPLFEMLAGAEQVTSRYYDCRFEDHFDITRAALTKAISVRTRLACFVSPSNPTGAVVRSETLSHVAALGIPAVLDEVFLDYPLDRDIRPPLSDGLLFRLGGLSKAAGLPHLKLGWIALSGPDEQVQEARARLSLLLDTYLSVSSPVQWAAGEILGACQVTRDAAGKRCRENLAVIRDVLPDTATVPVVYGGWSVPIRLPQLAAAWFHSGQGPVTDESWCLALLERGVNLAPGYFYNFPDHETWLVASLLTRPEIFYAGAKVLASLIESG